MWVKHSRKRRGENGSGLLLREKCRSPLPSRYGRGARAALAAQSAAGVGPSRRMSDGLFSSFQSAGNRHDDCFENRRLPGERQPHPDPPTAGRPLSASGYALPTSCVRITGRCPKRPEGPKEFSQARKSLESSPSLDKNSPRRGRHRWRTVVGSVSPLRGLRAMWGRESGGLRPRLNSDAPFGG